MIFLTREGRIATLLRQMPTEIPHLVEPYKLVELNQQLTGGLDLEELTRITEFFGSQPNKLDYSLICEKDEAGTLFLHLSINTAISLTCQRCMQLFQYSVERETTLQVAETEEAARDLPEGIEPILLDENRLNLLELLEDELMLAIPIVAMHEVDDCSEKVDVAEEVQEPETHKPFVGLDKLMQKTKQDK